MKTSQQVNPIVPDLTLYRTVAETNIADFKKKYSKANVLQQKSDEVLSRCKDRDNPPFEYYELHVQLDPLNEELREHCIVAAVFTLLFFEAYIYDYATEHLTGKYVKENYPKWDLVAKWSLIPELVTGQELNESKPGYKALLEIYEDKIYLTKTKKGEVKLGKNVIGKEAHAREINTVKIIKNCHTALNELPKELHTLHQEFTQKHSRN